MVQSITYREYVPLVVGTAAMSNYDLIVGNVPDNSMYDNKINPAIRNSFTTAAFRFGHATIPANFDMIFNDGTKQSIPIEDTFLGPFQIYDSETFDGVRYFKNIYKKYIHFKIIINSGNNEISKVL